MFLPVSSDLRLNENIHTVETDTRMDIYAEVMHTVGQTYAGGYV